MQRISGKLLQSALTPQETPLAFMLKLDMNRSYTILEMG